MHVPPRGTCCKKRAPMDERIVKEFPSIASARDAVAHKEYSTAVDTYTEVLEAARGVYDQKSEIMCAIYLEYSQALISLSFTQNYDNICKLSRKESITFADCDEDLEIAWELLEICRLTFETSGNGPMLRRTHFLLGEILLNNNKVEEALAEYERADCDSETLFRKALCYEFMGDYEQSIAILEQIKSENKELMEEVDLEILILRNKECTKALEDDTKPVDEKPIDADEIINIDMNVRRK